MISPAIGEQYAEPIAAIYRDAELRILERIAYSLQQGIDAPGWEQLQLARLQGVRGEVLALLAQANPVAAADILASLDAAYAQGELSAFADVAGTIDPLAGSTLQRQAAVAALAADTARALGSAQPAILRAVDDVYRQVVADAAASVLAGGENRRDATQRALNSLFSKGINSIETRGGMLGLPNYVTMAVRTATARAARQGHLDSMDAMELDLVTISPGPRTCDICDKWARALLTRQTTTGRLEIESVVEGPPLVVVVDDTLDNARAGGWGHPNCRCGLMAYLPGVTDLASLQRPPWDRAGYEQQQQQRGIELQIRSWKKREAVAITPAAKADARAKVAGWQGAMRDHLAKHPNLKRQSKREQINGTLGASTANARKPPPRGPGSSPIGPRPNRPGPTAPPAPASTTPRLDNLPRLAPSAAVGGYRDTALNDSNPLQPVSKNYQSNCTHCVSTNELRRRGFDVAAQPVTDAQVKAGGRSSPEILAQYRQADGEVRTFQNTGNATATAAVVKSWPEGGRGWVNLQWKGGGGHIFTVENIAGKVVYTDPQLPSRDASKFISMAKPRNVWIARVDDLDLTDEVLQFSDKLAPTALADAKAAGINRLTEEIAALNKRQAAIIAKLVAFTEGKSDEEARAIRLLSRPYAIAKASKSTIGQKIIVATFERDKLRA